MSELIALPYVPNGSWLKRTAEAFTIAWGNYLERRKDVKSYESWVDDIERLAAKD